MNIFIYFLKLVIKLSGKTKIQPTETNKQKITKKVKSSAEHVELVPGNGINTHSAPDCAGVKEARNGVAEIVNFACFSPNSAQCCGH